MNKNSVEKKITLNSFFFKLQTFFMHDKIVQKALVLIDKMFDSKLEISFSNLSLISLDCKLKIENRFDGEK